MSRYFSQSQTETEKSWSSDQKYQGNKTRSEEELRRRRWRIKGIKVSWYAGDTPGQRGGPDEANERQVCRKAGDKISPAYANFKAQVGGKKMKRSPCLPALSCCYSLRPGGGRPAGAPGVSCQTVSQANCCDSSNPHAPLLPSTFPPTSLLTRCGEPWEGPCGEREPRRETAACSGGCNQP